jgi:DNA-directed RNA polymerase subunit RPC12/RpoP
MKMDEVNKNLGILQKLDNEGFNLWKRRIDKDPTALDAMLEYNKVDVLALEELYLILRPWIKSHPNVNLYQTREEGGDIKCTHCSSKSITWDGYYFTPAGRYQSYRCNGCSAIGRSRYSDLTTEERKSLGLAIAN